MFSDSLNFEIGIVCLLNIGFGGSKRIAKQNDAYSAASMDGYKAPGKFSSGKQGKGKVRLVIILTCLLALSTDTIYFS
jgi:hypothetical protein